MLKLSRIDGARQIAEAKIDEVFAVRINAVLGPMAALHARKRFLAESFLIDDVIDRAAIIQRATEQDAELLAIDAQRREYKSRVRAASSSVEIQAIVAELGIN